MKEIIITMTCDFNKICGIALNGYATEGYLMSLIEYHNKEEEFMNYLYTHWTSGEDEKELHNLIFELTEKYAQEIEDFMGEDY